MLVVNDRIRVPLDEFEWSYARSGGPGGQNVNKVESKALLRWNVTTSESLPPDVKARFLTKNRNRLTGEGEFVLTSQRFRDQERNRQDCLDKLISLLQTAATPPVPRVATKPTKASKRRRLGEKKHQAGRKAGRKTPSAEES